MKCDAGIDEYRSTLVSNFFILVFEFCSPQHELYTMSLIGKITEKHQICYMQILQLCTSKL